MLLSKIEDALSSKSMEIDESKRMLSILCTRFYSFKMEKNLKMTHICIAYDL